MIYLVVCVLEGMRSERNRHWSSEGDIYFFKDMGWRGEGGGGASVPSVFIKIELFYQPL